MTYELTHFLHRKNFKKFCPYRICSTMKRTNSGDLSLEEQKIGINSIVR